MNDHERRQLLLEVKEFVAVGEAQKKAVGTLQASAMPARQRDLIVAAIGMAEKSMRKASIILLSWAIGAYEPEARKDDPGEARH